MVSTQATGPAFVDSGFAIARRSTMAANAKIRGWQYFRLTTAKLGNREQ